MHIWHLPYIKLLTHASPNRHDPQSFLDQAPEVSRPDLPVNAVHRCVKRCINDL